MKNPQVLLIIYIVLSIIEITGDIAGIKPIIYITKPLLMPVLILWFFALTRDKTSKFKKIIAVSIVASFFGDTFLLFVDKNEIFFLLGLGSFLIGQVLYGWAFILNIKSANTKGDGRLNILFAIVFGAFYALLMTFLYPSLMTVEDGNFLAPVLVYGLAICFMGLTAAYRYNKVPMNSYFLVLAGALTFVVSDTCIALDKFYFPGGFPYAQALIMVTYCSAQYLIVKGCAQYIIACKK